ncbi:MAG: AAA family ATPase [Candidatus Rokubacteria bacterium]|nr:AAA family ATPase [Candidatus Rokubacteria bacterium]
MIETHISWVLLAGERVYKIKKPVDLGFLDFTTLEQRRHFCEEEVRLNRRLTTDVYLGVVPIGGRPPHAYMDAAGPPAEFAVMMRRLPKDRMLDELVRSGSVDPALLETLGTLVARFHEAEPTGGEIDQLAGIDTVRRNWDENFAQTADVPSDVLRPEWRERLQAFVTRVLETDARRFDARVAAGRARDCHGDLQAAHICCTTPIQIFDCIEFNHRFRYIDTANEIAFLAMDLERLGRPDLAMRFLNAYIEASGDWDAVPLLDFYRSYRAFVRGKVVSFQMARRRRAAIEARELFALAARYTSRRPRPRLLVMSGVMGSGKSTVARALAADIEAIVIRTDAVRKRLAGIALTARAPDTFGGGLYTAEMGERTYAEALRLARELLGAGWNVIVDGSFSRAEERDAAREVAHDAGVLFRVLACDAPETIVVERLERRAQDAAEVSDGRLELLAEHRQRYERPARERDVLTVDTSRDTAALVRGLRDALKA